MLNALLEQGVDFIVVGGVALVLHGSARATQDLDICYARDDSNLFRLAAALSPFRPRLRDAPASLPFVLDAPALRSGLNFALTTSAGDVDLMGELTGAGDYTRLAPHAVRMHFHGLEVSVMDLDSLERAKAASGRLKDVLDLAEIRLLRRGQRS